MESRIDPAGRGAGLAWPLLGSRENSKPRIREMFEMAVEPTASSAYHPGARAGRYVRRLFLPIWFK